MEPTLQRVDARRSSGLCSSTTVSSWWLLLPGVVAAFLLQHAIQVPPVPVFRRLGFRTQTEID
jgi:hypothetical protein